MNADSLDAPSLLAWPVQMLLDRWPLAAQAFIAARVGCVGCQLAAFHTVGDVAGIYDIPTEDLLAEVANAVGRGAASDTPLRFDQGETE